MSNIYDFIIIGGGPAGLSAAIYGGRARLKTLLIEKGQIGGQAFSTRELVNYPGFFDGTSGPSVTNEMYMHAQKFGTEFIKSTVAQLDLSNEIKVVKTHKDEEFLAKTVILCPGTEPRSLNIKGEKELKGSGVSYCATCDAEFYEDQTVVVVGNGDAAIEESMYLTKFAKKVIVIVIHEEGKLDCNRYSADKAFKNSKIEFVWNSVLDEIKGDFEVEGVVAKNLKTGELTEIEAEGVFFYIGTVPRTDFIKDIVALDNRGYVITNEKTETSVDGVYCAGDARTKFLRQVVTSASDGAIAATAAERYIIEEEDFKENVINSQKPVILAFWHPGNQDSISTLSNFEKDYSDILDDFTFMKIDTSRNERIPKKYHIEKTPAILHIKNGEVSKDLSNLDKNILELELTNIIKK